mmetsp:Transcript_9838/g.19623  ORF Transcript_9838/g.19623 Transcript_9838/m.19623 type:complete len:257 (+) Transcript_9838:1362-2132(+)
MPLPVSNIFAFAFITRARPLWMLKSVGTVDNVLPIWLRTVFSTPVFWDSECSNRDLKPFQELSSHGAVLLANLSGLRASSNAFSKIVNTSFSTASISWLVRSCFSSAYCWNFSSTGFVLRMCWYMSGCVNAGSSTSLCPYLRYPTMSTMTSLPNVCRNSAAIEQTQQTASRSSALTWKIGTEIDLATSEQYGEDRAKRGSVVKPIWLFTMMWMVPPVVYPLMSDSSSVSYTMPWPAKAASPCSKQLMALLRVSSPR